MTKLRIKTTFKSLENWIDEARIGVFAQHQYIVNRGIREIATRLMRKFADKTVIPQPAIANTSIKKILLVRPNFRMGNSILAIPGIDLFRRQFPSARIDFVGTPVSKTLFQNLPIDSHYELSRSYQSCWAYPALIRKLRSTKYDLAVELSCSQSALGSFIVGMSGAKWRVGRTGKRDFWFNVKIPKSKQCNKYHLLPEFVASLGLPAEPVWPKIALSSTEKETGKKLLQAALQSETASCVAVFVGARERHGKRWPLSKFLHLIANLTDCGVRIIAFAGPEENRLLDALAKALPAGVPVISEPSLRRFAAMLSHCRLFVTCDSGPMHLACALGVRTVAIFQNANFDRWAPPAELARVVYDPQGVGVELVEVTCRSEISRLGLGAETDRAKQEAGATSGAVHS